jgi:hypothetical protein
MKPDFITRSLPDTAQSLELSGSLLNVGGVAAAEVIVRDFKKADIECYSPKIEDVTSLEARDYLMD